MNPCSAACRNQSQLLKNLSSISVSTIGEPSHMMVSLSQDPVFSLRYEFKLREVFT